jgi:hypothetical protein
MENNYSISNKREWYDIIQDGNGGEAGRVLSTMATFVSVNNSIDENDRKVLGVFYYDSLNNQIKYSYDRSPDMRFMDLNNNSNINSLVGHVNPLNSSDPLNYYYTDSTDLYSRTSSIPLSTLNTSISNVKIKKYVSSLNAYYVLSIGSKLYSITGTNPILYSLLVDDYDGRDFYPFIDENTQFNYIAYTSANKIKVLTNSNTTVIQSYGDITYTSAIKGNSAYFNNLANTPPINYINIKNQLIVPFSISLWFNTRDGTNVQTIFSTANSNFDNIGLNINLYNGDNLVVKIFNIPAISYTSPILANTWYHICFTLDSDATSKLYMNGAFYAQDQIKNFESSFAQIILGGDLTYPFTGYLDEFAAYNKILTPEEVTTLYNLGTVSSGRILYYPLDSPFVDTVLPLEVVISGDISYTTAIKNNSGVFNNNNLLPTNYIIISKNINISSSPISIAFWFYAKNVTNVQTILSYGDVSNTNNSVEINLAAGTLSLYVGTTGNWLTVESSVSIELNKWYCVFATISGSIINLYVNTQNNNTGSPTSTLLYTDQFVIGCNNVNIVNGFEGYIDEFYIFNNFNETNVTSFYNSLIMSDQTSKIIYLSFDTPIPVPINENYSIVGNANYTSSIVGGCATFINTVNYGTPAVNYITVPNYQQIPISISFWFNKKKNCPDDVVIISFTNNLLTGQGLLFFDGYVLAAIPSLWTSIGNFQCNINTWYHIVFTMDSTFNYALYVDGNINDSGNGTGPIAQYSTILLGGECLGLRGYDGDIDEFIVYNRVINPDEVKQLYNIKKSKINSLNAVSDGAVIYMPFNQNARTENFCVGTGLGGGTSMSYSYDGINWFHGNEVFNSGQSYAVAYNRSIYVAAGQGTDNTIAYSLDGINWIGCGVYHSTASICVGWNGSMWLAGGLAPNNLALSLDGINWKSVVSDVLLNATIKSIASNGLIWLIGGTDASENSLLCSSYDGINWTRIIGINSIITDINTIAWNGTIWLVGGYGPYTIAYSYDGMTWNTVTNTLLANCSSISWNGSLWVAGGNTLIYSSDGLNWTATTFGYTILSVAWNGVMWIACRDSGSIYYSVDGINWYIGNQDNSIYTSNMTNICSSIVLPITSAPSTNTLNITNGVMFGNVIYRNVNKGSLLLTNVGGEPNRTTNYVNIISGQNIPISISFWFNSNDSTNFQTILSFTNSNLTSNGINIDFNPVQRIVSVALAIPNAYSYATAGNIYPNRMNHIVLTISSTYVAKLYANGCYTGTDTGSSPILNCANIMIGGSADGLRGYNGVVENFMIYNRVINSDEIVSLYNLKEVVNGRIINIPFNEPVPIIDVITKGTNHGTITYTSAVGRNAAIISGNPSGEGQAPINYLTVPNNQNVPISISFWFLTTDGANYQNPVALTSADFSGAGIQFSYGPGSGETPGSIYIAAAIPSEWTTFGSFPANINTWYHVVFTMDSSFNYILYVNGINNASGTGTGAIANYSTFLLGGSHLLYRGFNGALDEFMVYNRVITADEVIDLYNLIDIPNGRITYLPLDAPIVLENPETIIGSINYTNSIKRNNALFINTPGDNQDPRNYIMIPNTHNIPITISFWFHSDDNTNYQTILSLTEKTFTDLGIGFDYIGDIINVYISLPTLTIELSSYITTSEANHITLTIDSSFNAILYVNGQSSDSDSGTGPIPYYDTFLLGGSLNDIRGYNGSIEEFIVYNRALGSDEVMKLFNKKNIVDGVIIYEPLNKTVTKPVGFIPSNIKGLNVWFDAADPKGNGTLYHPNTVMNTWYDKSGNNNNATLAAGSPLFTNSGISFDGFSYFNLPNGCIPYDNNSYSIYVVATFTGLNTSGGILGAGGSSLDDQSLCIRNNGNYIDTYWNNDTIVTSNTISYRSNFLYNSYYNSSSNIRNVFLNGFMSEIDIPSGTRVQPNGPNTLGKTIISEIHNGTISEFLVYNTPHTQAQRYEIEGYLAKKWNLQSQLPQDHPYSLNYWTPILLPNLGVWFDGSDPNGNNSGVVDGSTLSTWVDKSNNQTNAAASGGTTTIKNSFQNGLSVVNMNATQQFTVDFGTTYSEYTILTVQKCNASTSGFQRLLNGISGSTTDGILLYGTNFVTTDLMITTLWDEWTSYSPTYDMKNWGIVAVNVNSTSNLTFVNGVPEAPYIRTASGISGINIGGGYSGQNWNGYIGEILVFNGILSEKDRKLTEGYLANKWGLTSYLSKDHTFKLYPPIDFKFTPPQFAGLSLWLDGADPFNNGYSAINGNTVTTWIDKSGNGYNVTSVGNPVFFNNTILFNGSNAAFNTNYPANPLSETVFVVMKTNNVSQFQNIISSSTTGGRQLQLTGSYYPSGCYIQLNSIGVNTFATGNLAIVESTIFLYDYTFNSQNINMYIDGTDDVQVDGSYSFSNALTNIGVAGDSSYLNGSISEIIIYNSVLNDYQRQTVEGYLAIKWGLQSQLQPSHPFNTNIPYVSTDVPKQIPGLVNWLDSSDISTLFTDTAGTTLVQNLGDNVSLIVDKAGIANVTTFGTAPTYNPQLLNLKPGIDFSGSAGLISENVNKSKNVTLFWVGTINNNIQTLGTLWGHFVSNGSDICLRQSTSSGYITWQTNNDNNYMSLLAAINQPVIYIGTMENGINMNFTMITNSGIYKNISKIETLTWTPGIAYIYVGKDDLDSFSNVYMSEIIYYQRVLTQSEINTIVSYLGNKWGIKTELPSAPIQNTIQTWLPSNENTLAIWLDATDYATITANINTVLSITDKVSGIVMTTQGSDTTKLTLQLNSINNQPSLFFDSLENNVYLSGSYPNIQTGSALLVFTPQIDSIYDNTILTWASQYSIALGFLSDVNSLTLFTTGVGAALPPSSTLTVGTPYLIYFDWNGTSCSLSINGNTLVTGTIPIISGLTTATIKIGNDSNNYTMNFGELLLYSEIISEYSRQKAEGYLASKWGLSSLLPAEHPYYSAPLQKTLILYPAIKPAMECNGLLLWLDGADPNGTGVAPESGTNIRKWYDKSGNNNNFIQSNKTGTSVYGYDKYYNKNGIIFNGTQSYIQEGNSFIQGIGKFTIITAYRFDYEQGAYIYKTTANDTNWLWLSYIAEYTGVQMTVGANSATLNFRNITPSQGSGISSLVSDTTATAYLNGTNKGGDTLNIYKGLVTQNNVLFEIGDFAGSGPLTGSIFEMLVFDYALSDTERQNVESYLAKKWGLGSKLPLDHYYYMIPNPNSSIYGNVIYNGVSGNSVIINNDVELFSTNYITVPNKVKDLPISMSFWMNTNDTSTYQTIMGLSNIKLTSGCLNLDIYNNQLIANIALQNINYPNITTVINSNTWHHIALTIDNNYNGTLYLDNVKAGSVIGIPAINGVSNIGGFNTFILGGPSDQSSRSFNGLIQNFNVYDRVLSIDDVNNLYNVNDIYDVNSINNGLKTHLQLDNTIIDSNANINSVGIIRYSGVNGGSAVIMNNTIGTAPTNYITVPNPIQTTMTVSFWMNCDDAANSQTVVGFGPEININNNYISFSEGPVNQLLLTTNSNDYGTAKATIEVTGSLSYTAVNGKNCAYFDGTNGNYISIPFSHSSFTISFWLYSYSGIPFLLSDATAQNVAALLILGGDGSFVELNLIANSIRVPYAINTSTTGDWNNFTITSDGTNYNFYRNNTLLISLSQSNNFVTNLIIGNIYSQGVFNIWGNSTTFYRFSGYIRQLCVFDSVLTPDQLSIVYSLTQTDTPIYNGMYILTPIYKFLLAENSNNTGSLEASVTTTGSVYYTNIAGKNCISINVGNYLSFDTDIQTSWTLSFWTYQESGGFSFSFKDSSHNEAIMASYNADNFTLYTWYSWGLTSISKNMTNTWIQTTMTFDVDTNALNIYFNGIFAYSVADPQPISTITRIYIGASPEGGNTYVGYIRDFYVFNSVLSTDQIYNLYYSTNLQITSNKWYHICAKINPNMELVLYVDGANVLTKTYSGVNANKFTIGGTNKSFNGYIENFKVFNRLLFDNQIESLYNLEKVNDGLVIDLSLTAIDPSITVIDQVDNGLIPYTGGFIGGGAFINNGNYITIPNNTNIPLTIAFWMNGSNFYYSQSIFGIGINGQVDCYFYVANNTLSIRISSFDNATITYPIVSNTWTHVCLTIDFLYSAILYINGINVGTVTSTAQEMTYFSNMYLGTSGFIGDDTFTGVLDDFKVYNRVLTTTEISKLYQLNNVSYGLVTYLPLDISPINIKTIGTVNNSGCSSENRLGSGSAIFKGSNYITVKNYQSNPITISIWFNITTEYGCTIYSLTNISYELGINVNYNDDKSISYIIQQTSNQIIFNISAIKMNSWNHLCLTVDSNLNFTLYFNKNIIGIQNGNNTNIFATSLFVLGANNNLGNNFSGYLENFNVYNRALLESEVITLYDLGSVTDGLIINMPLNTNLPLYNFTNETVTGNLTYNTGKIGNAAFFVNTPGESQAPTNYITFPNNQQYPLSVSFWFNTNSTEYQTIVSLTESSLSALGIQFDVSNIIMTGFANWGTQINGNSEININTWNHVCLTIDPVYNATLYVNGNVNGSLICTGNILYYDTFLIGGSVQFARGFNGYIDDFQVYNKSLFPFEVSNIYTTGISGNSIILPGILSYLSLDNSPLIQTQNGQIIYSGVNGGSALINNDPTVTATDYITMTNAQNVPLTISFWFNTLDGINTQTLLSSNDSNIIQINLNLYGPNTLSAFIYLPTQNVLAPSINILVNTWYHVCLTIDSSFNCILYINGSNQTPASGSSLLTNYNTIYLGADGGGSNGFLGYIEEYSLYSRALSSNEVLSLYNLNAVLYGRIVYLHLDESPSAQSTGNILAELTSQYYTQPRIIFCDNTLYLYVISNLDGYIYSTTIDNQKVVSIGNRLKKMTDYKVNNTFGKLLITGCVSSGRLLQMEIIDNLVSNFYYIKNISNVNNNAFDLTNFNDEQYIFYIGTDNKLHQVWNPVPFIDIYVNSNFSSLTASIPSLGTDLYPAYNSSIKDYGLATDDQYSLFNFQLVIDGTINISYYGYPGQSIHLYNSDNKSIYIKLLPNSIIYGNGITKYEDYIPGYYLFADTFGAGSPYYYVFSSDGVPLWYRRSTTDPSYSDNPQLCSLFLGMGKNRVITVIFDGSRPRTVINVATLEEENYLMLEDSRGTYQGWDVHEVLEIQNPLVRRGNILYLSYSNGFYIQEQNKNHQIVWEFWSIDLVANNAPEFFHVNALDVHPITGDILCSFRNCSTIACINFNTKNVDWAIDPSGAFANVLRFPLRTKILTILNEPVIFDVKYNGTNAQHDTRWHYELDPLTPGNFMISAYDNQSFSGAPAARGVIYEINYNLGTAIWRGNAYSNSGTSGYMGSYKIIRESNNSTSHVMDYVQQHPPLVEYAGDEYGMPTQTRLFEMDIGGDNYRISKARPIDLDIVEMRKTSGMPYSTLTSAVEQIWNVALATGVTVTSFDTVIKTSSFTSIWDSSIFTQASYIKPRISFQISSLTSPEIGGAIGCGLSENPKSSVDYSVINYGIFFDVNFPDNQIYLYELGNHILPTFTITNVNTIYRVEYDGTNVKYYAGSVLLRSVAKTSSTRMYGTVCMFQSYAVQKIHFDEYTLIPQ